MGLQTPKDSPDMEGVVLNIANQASPAEVVMCATPETQSGTSQEEAMPYSRTEKSHSPAWASTL